MNAMSLLRQLLLIGLVSSLYRPSASSTSDVLIITSADLEQSKSGSFALEEGWRFNSGDDPDWSRPDFDDSEWRQAYTLLEPDELSTDPWVGIGWFRLRLQLDDSLAQRPLAFHTHQLGASEIYVNGRLVEAIGTVGGSRQEEAGYHETPLVAHPISFDPGVNLLAVRYSDHDLDAMVRFARAFGFRMGLAFADQTSGAASAAVRDAATRGAIFTAVPATLALLHLLLFLFYPQVRSNLYYALLTVSLALLTHQVFAHDFTQGRGELALRTTMIALFIVATSIASLRFLYSLFYERLPGSFRFVLVAGIAVSASFWFTSIRLVHIFSLICLAEALRVVVLAVLRRKEGGRIISVGFFLFIVACTYQLLGALGVVSLIVDPVYQYGMVAMLLTMSLSLARQFAGVSRGLQEANTQLTDYSHTLEDKVGQRTRELSEKNEELEKVLTELRGTQNQMIIREKMASLGGLVAGIAHEINSPVGAINSMQDTMSRAHSRLRETITGAISDTESRATIDSSFGVIAEAERVILDGTERVSNLVQSLRTFARLDEAEYQLVNINEGIDSAITLLTTQTGESIETVRQFGQLAPLYCAVGKLNQAFMNILKNSVEAMEGGSGRIGVTTYEDGDDIVIEVSDSGRGIEPERLRRIFDFDFARSSSTVKMGLGLATAYSVMQEHGGTIHIDSTLGDGTTVTVRLPRRRSGKS